MERTGDYFTKFTKFTKLLYKGITLQKNKLWTSYWKFFTSKEVTKKYISNYTTSNSREIFYKPSELSALCKVIAIDG